MSKDNNQIFNDNFYKAEKLYKEKKFLQSLKKYKELLTLNPKHISVLNNIGLNYEKLRQYDEAINYYEKCNEILPNQTILMHNLATMYCRLERFKDAIPLLKIIINSDYQKEANHEKFAICLFNEKNKKDTKNFIEMAIIKFPNNNVLNGLLGKTLLHLNLHKEGIKYLQKSTGLIEFNNERIDYLS